RYRELAERQIIPHLGDLKLQALKPEHLERWHAALLQSGISARTVGHAHRVLSGCLSRAVENGTIARNVAAVRKPPAVEEREIEDPDSGSGFGCPGGPVESLAASCRDDGLGDRHEARGTAGAPMVRC